MVEKTEAKNLKLADEKPVVRMTSPSARGSSGTNVAGGYIREEYLRLLQGKAKARIYDEMRRSDTQVSMLLGALKNPLVQAEWTIDEAEGEVDGKDQHAAFVRHALLNDEDVDFRTFVQEALTFVEFGHSVFEITHKV